MKMIRLLTMMFLLVAVMAPSQVQAQPAYRLRARRVIHRTAVVLTAARNELKKGQNYTGDFSRAVAHQRYARVLFLKGNYQRAILHSRRARMLAFASIKANKGELKKEWEFNKEEAAEGNNIPTDDQLDKELTAMNPGLKFDDRAAAQAELKDVDVDDLK